MTETHPRLRPRTARRDIPDMSIMEFSILLILFTGKRFSLEQIRRVLSARFRASLSEEYVRQVVNRMILRGWVEHDADGYAYATAAMKTGRALLSGLVRGISGGRNLSDLTVLVKLALAKENNDAGT